ncbi:MAG: peptide chain release factor N(5)-glutamine methyltransferase [Clostridiales bacterium]|nr:peptide chain release factor N(5)-glutamine methyltransferase [Clostridiales bacterium]
MSKNNNDNKYDTTKKMRRTFIGGQALLEGVMMRGKTSVAMAVRAPDGDIELRTERLKPQSKASKIPIVRGVISFVSSLAVGINALLKSAEVCTPEEESPSKTATVIATIVGVLLAVGLFIGLPFLVKWLIERFADYHDLVVLSVIEGGVRLALFITYLALIRLMKDIKRTFMYHGAEHRTINCYERGLPLTVENVQSCSTKHNRCGTTFIFFVVVFAIIVYALLNWLFSYLSAYAAIFSNSLFALAMRLLLLPLIAGLSYELLRGLAMLPDNKFTNIIRAPGLALQKLSTCIPDDDMAEVAIVAFNAVLELDEQPNKGTIDFYEREFAVERKKLADKLPDNPQDADWIYCDILGKSRGELGGVDKIKIGQVKKANEYADRLLNGEPLSYVLGNAEFCGIKLAVDNRVLIPRFETEVLAEEAVKHIGTSEMRVLDMCTGSGCIAAVIAKNTAAQVVAADLSDDALEVAKSNLKGLGADVVKSDMFDSIDGKFDLIVCNPPYIRTADIADLQSEVTAQPRMALDGGEDGLKFYRVIADNASEYLSDNGAVMLEVGYDQAQQVCGLMKKIGACRVIKDLDGKDRIVVCEK